MGSVLFLVGVGFVPVENTADERRNQEHARFSTGTRLGEGEQQRQVTVDAFFFQLLSSTDALPGGRQFDQDAVVADASIVVQFDQGTGFIDAAFGVVRQTGIDFSRDTARDQLQDFQTDIDGQLVRSVVHLLFFFAALIASPGNRFINQLAVFRDLRGAQDQGRVGGSILRLVQLHRCNVTGIGNNGSQLTQGSQFIRHGCHSHQSRVIGF